jgi:hypothetical protein
VSPTVFRERGYRFYFFSREEARKHVHIEGANGEAKFWLEPDIRLANSHGFSRQQLVRIGEMVKEHQHELIRAWDAFFGT